MRLNAPLFTADGVNIGYTNGCFSEDGEYVVTVYRDAQCESARYDFKCNPFDLELKLDFINGGASWHAKRFFA